MRKLNIIIASTRPGRMGLPIGTWFVERAQAHGKFDVELSDLKEIDLPFLDEAKHPRHMSYEQEHTKKWSARIQASDAFVFVTPEYNHGTPPALVNALDFLYQEWNYKPAGFVSYGGVSAGTRSVQMTKGILNALKVVPIVEAVTIPFFSNHMDDSGRFVGNDSLEKAAGGMLDELHRWAAALASLRSPPSGA